MINTNMVFWTGKDIIGVVSISFPINENKNKLIINDEYLIDKNHVFESLPFKDKNGKTIYEGDIVSARVTDNIYGQRDEIMSLIVFKNDIQYSISKEVSGGPDGNTDYTDIEVVGNFFTNPELLDAIPEYNQKQFDDFLKGYI